MADVPIRIIVFNAFLAFGTLYALRRGGSPERWTAVMLIVSAFLTAALPYNPTTSFQQVDMTLIAVDMALFVGLVALSLRANRFWPMWIAALQLLAITVHLIRDIDSDILASVYNRTVGKIAYPMILLLVIGTRRQYFRRSSNIAGADWSPWQW